MSKLIAAQKGGIMLLMTLIFLAGCGTTSGLRVSDTKLLPNLSRYSNIVILSFTDSTNKKIKDEKEKLAYEDAVLMAGRNFADRITGEIRKMGIFAEVSRGLKPAAEETVVISGVITRYEEGSAAMRFWIGMGAGSSYFDADVKFSDNISQEELGIVKVDKNSWWLGGGLASGQTVEAFMQVAAEKIAKELVKAKQFSEIKAKE